jgi:glycosyltransferase involved in cell wall biosynthesis
LILFSSQWAADSAVNYYDVDRTKIHVIPFGANIDEPPSAETIKSKIADRPRDKVKLLFVGVDWVRKGGDFAIAVAGELNKRGLQTELNLVGSRPAMELPSFVRYHGFLSKSKPSEASRLNSLYSSSHFFILPTRAECCAIAFGEASSFGVPTVTTDVGGVSSAITSGLNGERFKLDEPPERWADYVSATWRDIERYNSLALSSLEEYSRRLNWRVAGGHAAKLVSEIVAKPCNSP